MVTGRDAAAGSEACGRAFGVSSGEQRGESVEEGIEKGGVVAVRADGELWELGESVVGVLPDDAGRVEVCQGRVPLA